LRQQKVYDIEQVFLGSPYTQGMLADDDSISTKPYVIKPKKVIADMSALVNSWDAEGWTKNAAEVKASITAKINAGNNSRIDTAVTDDEAKALRIVSAVYNFLF
jgi:phage tail sheath gpL-like